MLFLYVVIALTVLILLYEAATAVTEYRKENTGFFRSRKRRRERERYYKERERARAEAREKKERRADRQKRFKSREEKEFDAIEKKAAKQNAQARPDIPQAPADTDSPAPQAPAAPVRNGSAIELTSTALSVIKTENKIPTVRVPGAAGTVAGGTFAGRTSPMNVIVGEGVLKIENYAFSGCEGLRSVSLPSTLRSIGTGAFNRCTALSEILIPDRVQTFGDYVFYGCENLRTTTYAGARYVGNKRNPHMVLVGVSHTFGGTVKIHRATVFIDSAAFSECADLRKIVIPPSVQRIGSSAFQNCRKLVSVVLKSGTREIGDAAFWGCTSLSEITIPGSVVKIGDDAFNFCTDLTVHAPSFREMWSDFAFPDGTKFTE